MVLPPFAKALGGEADGPEMGGGLSSTDWPGLVKHSSPLTAQVEERAEDIVGSAFDCEPFPRGEG